jgi:hypothetical protein
VLNRWAREDYLIEYANREAMKKAGVDKNTLFKLEGEYKSGRLTKEEYDTKTSELIDQMQNNTRRLEEQTEKRKDLTDKLRGLDNQLLGLEEGGAAEKRQKFLEDGVAAGLGYVNSVGVPKGDLSDYVDRYDRATAEIEGKKEFEKREKELDRLREREQDEAVRAEEDRFRRERETKKRLRSPEQIARDELRDMNEFRGSLTVSEYDRGRRGIAEKLMGSMGGGEIATVGMMSAGSAELHSLVAKASMPDPKVAMMQQALTLLHSIERELQAERGEILQ